MSDPQLNAILRKLASRVEAVDRQNRAIADKYSEFIESCKNQPRSITQEIDSIPGRRIFYTLGARADFTTAQEGLRANPLTFLVSQDGPFICTHYPIAIWKANAPTTATNFGMWRPISTWPLPDQVLDTDIVDISYEVVDSGSQRNFQNEAVAPILSRPDNLIPLPVPTLFAPNTTIQFFATFEQISFNTGGTATTGGELYVGFPGYRIVNL